MWPRTVNKIRGNNLGTRMRDGEAVVRAGDILSQLTIRVKGLSAAIMRVRIARAIFSFGAFVAGAAIEIEIDDQRQ